MKKPVIVLVGRPNVGKSTLFNRLVGERLAIIDDVPGTTRDRLVAEGDWAGHDFFVVDTGGIDPTRQRSQEPLSIGSAAFIADIREQAEIAMEEADVILLLTDAQQGVTEADREIVEILRRRQSIVEGRNHPPIILAVNKADSELYRANALDFSQFPPYMARVLATCWTKWCPTSPSRKSPRKKIQASKSRLWESPTLENPVY